MNDGQCLMSLSEQVLWDGCAATLFYNVLSRVQKVSQDAAFGPDGPPNRLRLESRARRPKGGWPVQYGVISVMMAGVCCGRGGSQ
jgi:hypothetical protein